MDLIIAKNIKKEFYNRKQKLQVLNNINLTVKEDEFVAILGESLSGKSTLTNILSGMDSFFEGDVIINGIKIYELSKDELIKYRNENITVIFDTFNDLNNKISAIENIEIAILSSKNKKDIKNRAFNFLQLLKFKYDSNIEVNMLPQLERQKVAIARALALEAKILIADEPTNCLDKENCEYFFFLLEKLRREYNMTIVMFTQLKEETKFADRILHLRDGVLNEINSTLSF